MLPALVGVGFSAIATALIGLVCNVAAFDSETFRAGILSIRPGQTHAGLAVGMSGAQVMHHVVLPALATTWVSLFKDTSLVPAIAVADLSYAALQVRSETFRVMEVLTGMAALYWLVGYPQAKLVAEAYVDEVARLRPGLRRDQVPFVHALAGPGLGVETDWAAMERAALGRLCFTG